MPTARWTSPKCAVLVLLALDGALVAALLRAKEAPAQTPWARLSVVDWNAYDERENDGPGSYSFGYEIEDAATANTQFRQEERFANGTVSGSYGLVEPDGNVRIVTYVADAQGYRARVENSLRKGEKENYPRVIPAQPWRPQTAWPGPPASDRLLETGNAPKDVEATTPTAPLAWALLALQAGKRTPLHEQRQRPASGTKHAVNNGARRPQRTRLPPTDDQQKQQLQQTAEEQRLVVEQYSRHLQQQQQRRLQQLQPPYNAGNYYPAGDELASPAIPEVRNAAGDDALYSNALANDNNNDMKQAGPAGPSWSAQPIVVWAAQAAPAPAPRYGLPPIPLLDKLVYQRQAP